MKKMKYIMSLALLGLLAVSCADFLERQPLDSISDGNYWKTPNDLKLYMNNLYSNNDLLPLDNGYGGAGPFDDDAQNGTDIALRYNYNTRMNGEATIPADDNGWGSGDWGALRNINYFLVNYKPVEDAVGFDAVKQYVGEALFFRSLFYFNKLTRFGDLPWIETVLNTGSEELMGARLPRNEVVAKIMADLDNAVKWLPARGGSAWTGRLTKEVALALQARIALYEGTWEKYHAGDDFKAATNESVKFLTKAAEASNALMEMAQTNGYPSLYTVGGTDAAYRELFIQTNYATVGEVLFHRQYEAGALINRWQGYTYCSGGSGATKSMMDSYLKLDGTPIDPATFDYSSLTKVAEGRDPRLSMSTFIDDGKHYYWELTTPARLYCVPYFDGWDADESAFGGYGIYKGHNYHFDRMDYNVVHNSLIYYRYGETLLIYAEAKAELGQLTQADLDRSVNLLRDRVGMPHMTIGGKVDPNFEFAELGADIQAVRRERKVELAHEGFRYNDIMRWAAADELIVGKTPVGAVKAQWVGLNIANHPYGATEKDRQKGWDERVAKLVTDKDGLLTFTNVANIPNGMQFNVNRDYLNPIPTNQLTLNPQLKQNPGWSR